MRPRAVLSVFALVAVAYLATFAAVAGPAALAFGLISQLIFLLPGVLIVRAMGAGWLAALAFGPFISQALGRLVLTLSWPAGGRGVWLLAAVPLLVAVVIAPTRRLAGRFRLPATEPDDAVALACLLLLVPLMPGLGLEPITAVAFGTLLGGALRGCRSGPAGGSADRGAARGC